MNMVKIELLCNCKHIFTFSSTVTTRVALYFKLSNVLPSLRVCYARIKIPNDIKLDETQFYYT